MKRKYYFILIFTIIIHTQLLAQSIHSIVNNAKVKIEKVRDYKALGKMKTNVNFLKVPLANVLLYYKNPKKFKLVSESGLSFVPKGSMSINLNNIFADGSFTVIDGGTDKVGNTPVRVAKLLPDDDNNEMVLTTLYIDPVNSLILRSKMTTKENGTYELRMRYNSYIQFGLPDEIVFSFNTKDYKLPKGITFDFDDGSSSKSGSRKEKPNKGEVTISISKYEINKGLQPGIFQ